MPVKYKKKVKTRTVFEICGTTSGLNSLSKTKRKHAKGSKLEVYESRNPFFFYFF